MAYRNFLITYSGRVGSTALIDHLKLIPDVVVPLFEELDYWHVEQNGELDRINEANVHAVVDDIIPSIARDGRRPNCRSASSGGSGATSTPSRRS